MPSDRALLVARRRRYRRHAAGRRRRARAALALRARRRAGAARASRDRRARSGDRPRARARRSPVPTAEDLRARRLRRRRRHLGDVRHRASCRRWRGFRCASGKRAACTRRCSPSASPCAANSATARRTGRRSCSTTRARSAATIRDARPAFVPTPPKTGPPPRRCLRARGVDGPFARAAPDARASRRSASAGRRRGFIALGARACAHATAFRCSSPATARRCAGRRRRSRSGAARSRSPARRRSARSRALAERARYVVAMDSGPMHVAAAVGAPTVGIFALQSDEPDRWAPLGPRTAVVRAVYPCPPGTARKPVPISPACAHLDIAASSPPSADCSRAAPKASRPVRADDPTLHVQPRALARARARSAVRSDACPIDAYEVVLVNDGSPDETQRGDRARARRSRAARSPSSNSRTPGSRAPATPGSRGRRGERIIFIDDDVLPTPVVRRRTSRRDERHGDVIVRGAVINTESFDELPVPVWTLGQLQRQLLLDDATCRCAARGSNAPAAASTNRSPNTAGKTSSSVCACARSERARCSTAARVAYHYKPPRRATDVARR